MKYPQLPDAELIVMQTIWEHKTPISGLRVTELLKPIKKWKHQTVSTLLSRLTDKGFLSSEKRGKERFYTPHVVREDYLSQETDRFIKDFHKNSLTGLMRALISAGDVTDDDLNELTVWLKNQRPGGDDNV